jgi:hypothetical protein
MSTFEQELNKIMQINDSKACTEALISFIGRHKESLPLPGENAQFDKAIWLASSEIKLSPADMNILKKVTDKLLVGLEPVKQSINIRDLLGAGKDQAINLWQELLAGMSWQQMVPAGATRGIGAQMVSLGTFGQELGEANIQINVGWLVDKEHLRILLNAKDSNDNALSNVELRIKESSRGIVYTKTTNNDGAVVAPNIEVKPGQYQIEIAFEDKLAQTPYFIV